MAIAARSEIACRNSLSFSSKIEARNGLSTYTAPITWPLVTRGTAMIDRRFCMITDCWPLKRSSRLASVVTTASPILTTCSMTVREPRNCRAFSGSASPRAICTDMLPSIGSTRTMNPRAAFIRVMTRSMTFARTTSRSSEELRSRASSYSRWSRMPRSTSCAKAIGRITAGVVFSLSPKGQKSGPSGPWVNSISRGRGLPPSANRRLACHAEPAPAGSGHAWRWPAAHLRRRGQRQDPRAHGADRLPHRLPPRVARPAAGGHLHEQGGQGDAEPRGDAGRRSGPEDVGGHLSLDGRPHPGPGGGPDGHPAEFRLLRRGGHAGRVRPGAGGPQPRPQPQPVRRPQHPHPASQDRPEAAEGHPNRSYQDEVLRRVYD